MEKFGYFNDELIDLTQRKPLSDKVIEYTYYYVQSDPGTIRQVKLLLLHDWKMWKIHSRLNTIMNAQNITTMISLINNQDGDEFLHMTLQKYNYYVNQVYNNFQRLNQIIIPTDTNRLNKLFNKITALIFGYVVHDGTADSRIRRRFFDEFKKWMKNKIPSVAGSRYI